MPAPSKKAQKAVAEVSLGKKRTRASPSSSPPQQTVQAGLRKRACNSRTEQPSDLLADGSQAANPGRGRSTRSQAMPAESAVPPQGKGRKPRAGMSSPASGPGQENRPVQAAKGTQASVGVSGPAPAPLRPANSSKAPAKAALQPKKQAKKPAGRPKKVTDPSALQSTMEDHLGMKLPSAPKAASPKSATPKRASSAARKLARDASGSQEAHAGAPSPEQKCSPQPKKVLFQSPGPKQSSPTSSVPPAATCKTANVPSGGKPQASGSSKMASQPVETSREPDQAWFDPLDTEKVQNGDPSGMRTLYQSKLFCLFLCCYWPHQKKLPGNTNPNGHRPAKCKAETLENSAHLAPSCFSSSDSSVSVLCGVTQVIL